MKLRLHTLIFRLACAGLVSFGAALPAAGADNAIHVITDGDPNTPDDLAFTLPVAAGETLADLRLVEDGQENSVLGQFLVRRQDAATLSLTLSPALDLDHLKDVKAAFRARIESLSGGASREVLLPLAIDPASQLAGPLPVRLAVPAGATRIVPVLPLAAAGNARLAGITTGADKTPFPYALATGPDGTPLAVGQEAAGFSLGDAQRFDLAWTLAPGGKTLDQALDLTPVALADLDRDLDAPLNLAPAPGQASLAFDAGAAANLAVEDVLLLSPASPDKSAPPASVAPQFERSTTAAGDVRFTLKADNTLAGADQAGQTLTLAVQKRLDGQGEASQIVHVTVQGGSTASSAKAAALGGLPSPALRTGTSALAATAWPAGAAAA
ncbi:MAG: hypothetical protein K8F27_02565, partial [Sulfuricellaceae bacterium]|nr:hypothetical protein [Sulfuricellaceae bacterium]